MSERPRLVLIPGLGMDGRTFALQRGIGAEVVVPGWIRPGRDETLEGYSARLAGTIGVGEGAGVFGGVSIGGAIALELSRRIKAEGVFLIASATTAKAIPNLLRSLGRVAPWVPEVALRPFVRLAPPVVRLLMRQYPPAGEILGDAIRHLDLEVWRWGARAIMNWEYRGEFACPVHQVHGDADPITPVYRVRPDVVVHGGGHMLNVTHAGEVNGFLCEKMGVRCGGDGGGG